MSNRSKKLIGRILRNLKRHGITASEIEDEEILDELTQGQTNIISEVNIDKIITLTLAANVNTYRLTTSTASTTTDSSDPGTSDDPGSSNDSSSATVDDIVMVGDEFIMDSQSDDGGDPGDISSQGIRINIASIKVVKIPDTWRYKFIVVPNKEFVEKVNANGNTPPKQPVIATVIDNKIKLFPTPSSDYNGQVLEFYVYLSASTKDITKDVEPELPEYFDKCLEGFATAQFLSGNDRAQWLTEYNIERKRLRGLPHRKHHNLQRERVW